MNSQLGLKQIPAGPARVRAAAKAPPKRMGEVWGTVTIVAKHTTAPKVQCKLCGKMFCAGVTRIEQHITGQGVIGPCTVHVRDGHLVLDLKHKLTDKSDASTSKKRQKAGEASVEAAADEKPIVIKSEVKQEFKQQGIGCSLTTPHPRRRWTGR